MESSSAQSSGQSGGNILIAYFSWGGNTRGIAEEIQRQTGADLFEIEMVTPYSTDYNTVLDQAQEAQNNQDRPELSTHVEDMSQYDTILLGYPNWWASIPMPVASFLEEYDFTGKTIVPFCTSGGSGMGSSASNLEGSAEGGVWLSGARLNGGASQDEIAQWVDGLGLELPEE